MQTPTVGRGSRIRGSYDRSVTKVRLRATIADDLPKLHGSDEDDPFLFYGFTATNGLERRFATDGSSSNACLSAIFTARCVATVSASLA